MKLLLKMMLVVSAVMLVGCGGGGTSKDGGKNPSSTDVDLTYKGKTEKVKLTENNTKYFVDLINASYSKSVYTVSSPKLQKSQILQQKSFKLSSTMLPSRKVIDKDSRNGVVSGTLSILVEETGKYTGKITLTYKNFSDVKGLVANGKVIQYITVNKNEVTTKSKIDYQLFNVKLEKEDITIDGTVSASLVTTGTVIVENYVVKNNKTSEMIKYDNYKTLLNKQGQIVSYQGRIYDSNYGYVEVSTLALLAYTEGGTRKPEGELKLEGESSSVNVKYAYDNRIRVEIDANKDGVVDDVQVYREGEYETELPNAAPIVNITFPQSIFTDTDMSEVKVNVYDPDLDGFTVTNEWQINGAVSGTELALDNILFKKHDILKLVVVATDDRAGDSKTNTQSKEQEVLNSAPKIVLELDKTTIEVGEKIVVDASKSYDVDGDDFTYTWTTQNRSYNTTESTNNLGTQYLDINESNKSKIIFKGERVNYISYAASSEIQPYGINIKLDDGDSNGTSEMESSNIIVVAMDIFDNKETISKTADIISGSVGDLNSDGLLDVVLIVGHPSDKAIKIFIQDMNNKFSLTSTILLDTTAPISYASLSIADMNNDAENDIIVVLGSYGSNGFNVYYQDKNLGTFSKQNYKPTPVSEIPEEEPSVSDIDYLVIGDMNKNGKDDVVTVGYSNSFAGIGNNVEIFIQAESNLEHNKTWTIESIDDEFPISYLSLIDADGNSNLDIISKNHILYQENDGTYVHKSYKGMDNIVFTDLNSDNNNELIGINGFDNKLFIYKNSDSDKRNYLEDKSKNIFGDSADQIYSADVNGNQKKDIIIGHSGLGFFTVYIDKENDFLENQMYWMSGGDALNNAQSILVDDMNNDGKDDVIMFGQDRFEVFYTK